MLFMDEKGWVHSVFDLALSIFYHHGRHLNLALGVSLDTEQTTPDFVHPSKEGNLFTIVWIRCFVC